MLRALLLLLRVVKLGAFTIVSHWAAGERISLDVMRAFAGCKRFGLASGSGSARLLPSSSGILLF